jgi:hypothetical protein
MAIYVYGRSREPLISTLMCAACDHGISHLASDSRPGVLRAGERGGRDLVTYLYDPIRSARSAIAYAMIVR